MVCVARSATMFSPIFRFTRRMRMTDVPVAGILVMASAGAVYAQESVSDTNPRVALSIVPRVSVTETVTDNVRLSTTGQQSDQVTEISPGIRIISDSSRLKGYFDYSLNEILYAQNSSDRQTQNALSTLGTWEAIDNWAYLDFSASISQQTVSAFDTRSFDNTSINANRAEVARYRLSPYVRGRLGGSASYEARYSRSVTSSDSAALSGVATDDGLVKISGDSSFRRLGWSVDASEQRVDYSAGRATEADRVNLGLSYAITPQFRVLANGGREANNYTSFDKQSYGNGGFGVNWSPSERTRLSASRDHRSFGDSHSLNFEHRTARTAWRFSDTKGVSVMPDQTGSASLALSDILYSQYLSGTQNPIPRAQFNALLPSFFGINPSSRITFGVLMSALSLERRQDLSFALLGVRDTVTFSATRSESSRLDTVATGIFDDLTKSTLLRQRGFGINYAHRLTPDYSLTALASQQNTTGDTSLQDSTLQLFNLSVTGKVGRQASGSVGVRRVVYDSSFSSYTETALIVTLTVQF